MFLSIIFLLASTNFAFNCADNAKGSDEIHPNFADYNPNKLLGELQEMANSLSDAGGKAAEEMALVKGCQIIQKLQGNSTKYPKVVAEHSEFARLLQSVAKVCNEAKKDNSTSNFELIETFEKNGPPILAQLKLKEQQLLQELKNAKKDSELIEISGLVAKLCLNVLPEGHPWKSALKELLGDNVHLLPSDLVQFLISKMNFMTEQQLGSPKAYHRRIRRAVQRRRWPIIRAWLQLISPEKSAISLWNCAFGIFYQFISIMLLIESMMFSLPNFLWKFFVQKIGDDFIAIIEGGAIKLKGMEKAPIEERQKLIKCLHGMLSEAVLHQSWGAYVTWYVSIKMLNLVNVGTQFVVLNSLTGHGYRLWGFEVLKRYINQCHLRINSYNEKIFFLIWWFILSVAFLTLFNFVYCLCVLLPLLLLPHSREFFVRGLLTQERRQHCHLANCKQMIRQFADELGSDGLLLFWLIEVHANRSVTRVLMRELFKGYEVKCLPSSHSFNSLRSIECGGPDRHDESTPTDSLTQIDHDQDGKVSVTEFERALNAIRKLPNVENMLMELLTVEDLKGIFESFDNLRKVGMSKDDGRSGEANQRVRDEAAKADMDGDGTISGEEFDHHLQQM
uniref:Innexin n=1 Tax=Globodera rostochiensis TaxID=31243 RepID=A0A914GPG6_GLORO